LLRPCAGGMTARLDLSRRRHPYVKKRSSGGRGEGPEEKGLTRKRGTKAHITGPKKENEIGFHRIEGARAQGS